MKYIIFTFYGVGYPIAYKLLQEGHDVIVAEVQTKEETVSKKELSAAYEDDIERLRRLSLYNGLIEKVPAHKMIKKMADFKNKEEYFVFFDFNNLFQYAEQIQKMGFHGNFPTEEDYLFEQDRNAAKEFVHKYYPKLNIAEVKEYDKVSPGIEFLKKTDEVWVLKGKDESAKTFVPDTEDVELAAKQIIENLETYKEAYEHAGYILELLIPAMVELTPQKIYYDGVPLGVTIDIENKPLGSSNLSIQTSCAADLVFPISMDDRICELAFPPYIDELARNHKGLFVWDASLLINKRTGKIYFGEFCSNRMGYNAIFTEFCQLPSVSHYFEKVIKQESPYNLGTVGVSTTIFNLHRDPDDRHILAGKTIDYKKEAEKDVWLYDVTKDKNRLSAVGYDINLAAVTGSGKSIDDAIDSMFRNIEKFSYVGAYYRPKDDYTSLNYASSIPNRLNYGLERNLYTLPFNVKIGDLM